MFVFSTKNIFLLLFFVGFSSKVFAANQEGKLKPSTNGLDILVYNVDVVIQTYSGESITYSSKTDGNSKISFIEHKKRFRIRSIYPVKGTVFLNIPEKMVLESCRIHSSYGSIKTKNIKAAYFTSAVSEGQIDIDDCVFKDAVFNCATGTLNIKADILSAADICTTDTKADITFLGSLDNYNFYYAQGAFSSITVNGKLQNKPQSVIGNVKSKRRIKTVAGTSDIFFHFIQPAQKEPPISAQIR